MMILPTKREMELHDIWISYVEKAIIKENRFKGYKLKDDAPKKVHDAYREWEEIVDNKPQNPNFM